MLNILTLNFNGKEKLGALYPSLKKNLSDIDYKWFIKDNASRDNSMELIKSWNDPKIIAIDYPHNKDNFSEGCNFLFKESCSKPDDLVLLLNNDITFNDTDSLNKMISLINSDPEIGVVGARLKFTNTNLLQHAGVMITNFHTPTHFRLNRRSDHDAERNRLFQIVTGAVLLTKAKYFIMDNQFRWMFDDVDLCLHIKYNLNKKIVYCGQTDIFHEGSATLKINPVNKLFTNHNLNLFRKKWSARYVIDQDRYIKDSKYNLYK